MVWDIFRSNEEIEASRKSWVDDYRELGASMVSWEQQIIDLSDEVKQVLGTDISASEYTRLDAERAKIKEFRLSKVTPQLDKLADSFDKLDGSARYALHSFLKGRYKFYEQVVSIAIGVKRDLDIIKARLDNSSTDVNPALSAGLASVQGVPAKPAIPAIPSIPAMPSMPGIPSIPATPAVPAMPAVPAIAPDVFSAATKSLSSIGDIASSLPSDMAATLAASQAELGAKMMAATTTLNRDVGIAKAAMDLQNRIAFATTGKEATPEALSAAAGPIGVLSKGPALLASHAKEIASSVASMSTSFGVNLPAGIDPTVAAKLAGRAVSRFTASIPPKTIPNPAFNRAMPADPVSNPETLPNPVYVEFAADPENADKIDKMSGLADSLSTMASNTSSAFAEIQTKAAEALSAAISTIKAMSTLSVITAPAPPQILSALTNSVDYEKIDAAAVKSALLKSAPKLPEQLPGMRA